LGSGAVDNRYLSCPNDEGLATQICQNVASIGSLGTVASYIVFALGEPMATIEPKYTTSVRVSGGRQGHAVSDDGVLNVQLRTPKLRGANDGTNPEQLFAAAWAGCFGSALNWAANQAGIDAEGSTVKVEISQGADGGYGLSARIFASIPGVDLAKVQELAEAAHQICPYSNATRGNIAVEVSAV
jgi:Ohr subfamily peroxiredoxin